MIHTLRPRNKLVIVIELIGKFFVLVICGNGDWIGAIFMFLRFLSLEEKNWAPMNSKYSQALRRRVKTLYLDGYTYKEIAKKIMEYERAMVCMLQRVVYTKSDYKHMESELKKTEERYEKLKDLSGPVEKRLEKKWIRLKRILRGRI